MVNHQGAEIEDVKHDIKDLHNEIKDNTKEIHDNMVKANAGLRDDFNRGFQGLNGILVTLAEQQGEIRLVKERQLLEGRRVDDAINRLNRHLDSLIPKQQTLRLSTGPDQNGS